MELITLAQKKSISDQGMKKSSSDATFFPLFQKKQLVLVCGDSPAASTCQQTTPATTTNEESEHHKDIQSSVIPTTVAKGSYEEPECSTSSTEIIVNDTLAVMKPSIPPAPIFKSTRGL